MKKLLSVFMLLCLIVFVGCNKTEKNAANKNIVLSFGTQDNPGNPLYTGYKAFADKLAEIYSGTMTIEIYGSSQLGPSQEMFNQVTTDDLDIVSAGYPDMSYIIPELALVGQLYVVRDYDHLLKILDSEYGKRIEKQFNELGVHVSSVWYAGVRQTTSNRPLNSLEDFKWLKLRIPNVDFLISYTKAVDSSASPVAFSELYLALQTGQVDAQENPLSTIESQKMYEVQKYLAITDHFIASSAIFINNDKYNSFTDEQKKWYNEAVEYGGKICSDLFFEEEKFLIEKFQNENGVTVTYPDLEPFREAMKPFYAELEKEYGEGAISDLMAIQ